MRDIYICTYTFVITYLCLSVLMDIYHKFSEICYPSRNGAKLLHFPMVQIVFSDGPYGSMMFHVPFGYD